MKKDFDDDPLLRQLAELPAQRPDDLHFARVRRQAQAVLAEERRLAAHPWMRPVDRLWNRLVVPTLLAGTIGTYLTWAVQFSAQLYR